MIARVGTGWQTLLADLSIILFIITAAALSQANHERQQTGTSANVPSPRSTPLAIYRAGEGAPTLRHWLAEQQRDPRQLLTIVAPYGAGHQRQALAAAETMARDADALGVAVRVVVEPGEGAATATLAYDSAAPSGMAQPLLVQAQTLSQGDKP